MGNPMVPHIFKRRINANPARRWSKNWYDGSGIHPTTKIFTKVKIANEPVTYFPDKIEEAVMRTGYL